MKKPPKMTIKTHPMGISFVPGPPPDARPARSLKTKLPETKWRPATPEEAMLAPSGDLDSLIDEFEAAARAAMDKAEPSKES